MNVKNQLRDGLFFQNPVTVQLLGMCSVMALTTTLFNGLGMGVSGCLRYRPHLPGPGLHHAAGHHVCGS